MTDPETFEEKVERVSAWAAEQIEANPTFAVSLSDNERGPDPDVLEKAVGEALAQKGYATAHWQGQLYMAKTADLLPDFAQD